MPKKKTTSTKKKTVRKAAKKAVKKTAKKKAAKKTPAKKAARKAAKKSAKKVAKKAARKVTKKAAKKSPAKKVARKTVKKTVNKNAVKKATSKKSEKSAAKKAAKKVARTTAAKKTTAKNAPAITADKIKSTKVSTEAPKSGASDPKITPIVFSLDDVEQFMATKKSEVKTTKKPAKKAVKKTAAKKSKKFVVDDKPAKQRVLGAASLADILGFNPAEKQKSTDLTSKQVPKKWKKYYNLLIELRSHVSDEIDLHTAETLKHSSRDESGDLSSYGTHQADAGTDTFDRDFALSLVSSEQEALNEIEEAIIRIKNGTYGVCEVTGKAIPAARLTAVPFARYSVEGQAEYEKNVRRKVDRSGSTGLFGDASDAPKLAASDDDE